MGVSVYYVNLMDSTNLEPQLHLRLQESLTYFNHNASNPLYIFINPEDIFNDKNNIDVANGQLYFVREDRQLIQLGHPHAT